MRQKPPEVSLRLLCVGHLLLGIMCIPSDTLSGKTNFSFRIVAH